MPDFGFDEWLDAQLRNVPVPRDLHARLSATRRPSDEELDAALCDVPVPPHLERHLRRIAQHNRRISVWRSLAVAASVLIALGTGTYWGFSRDTPAANKAVVAKRTTPAGRSPKTAAPPSRPQHEGPQRRQEPITVPLAPAGQWAEDQPSKLPFTLQDVATVSTTIKQAVETRLRAQAALGASGKIEQLSDLDVFEPPPARGLSPPRLRGYDLLFQLKQGEHPFVSPAMHKDLRVSRVPFTFRTSSYDQALDNIEKGRLPPREEIRVEDFLAAQRYALSVPPAAGLALHVAACPCPLGEAGLHFLQLTVQGGAVPQVPHRPSRLIVVVDTSTAMRFDARSRTLERALEKLSEHLDPDDRLTLIGFAEQPRVLAENATRDELAELLAAGTLRQTAGSADFTSAIQSACEAVHAVTTSDARQVVFVTAGRAELDDAQLGLASSSLLRLVAADIPWQIVRLNHADDRPHWSDLARRAHGRSSAVTSAEELFAVLLETLSGRPQTVAHGVSMRIAFNPKVVTSYRLLGHESATLTGEASDPLEVDLHAGQTATNMYQLWVRPGDDELAVVELLWHDPRNGQPRRRVQPILRAQVASSFRQAPAWLQQGILAASTAEFLRGSYYVPNSRRLGQLLELTAEVDARAAELPDFQGLVRMIEAADRLR